MTHGQYTCMGLRMREPRYVCVQHARVSESGDLPRAFRRVRVQAPGASSVVALDAYPE